LRYQPRPHRQRQTIHPLATQTSRMGPQLPRQSPRTITPLTRIHSPGRPAARRIMTADMPRGVIAAIATAIDETGEPDCARSIALARFLLDHGCDGLNVLGTN